MNGSGRCGGGGIWVAGHQWVSVCDIAGKVADGDAIFDGIVDGAELLSNSCLGEGRACPVDLSGWGQHREFVGDSEGGFRTSHDEESVARVVGMTGGVGCDGAMGGRGMRLLVVSQPRLQSWTR